MPKSFSEKERAAIVSALRQAASDSLRRVGIKKTTVDDLTAAANIPKGTFYRFYESKELLIFEVILGWHEEIHRELLNRFAALPRPVTADALTDAVLEILRRTFDTGLLPMMVSGELELLMRRLPDEAVSGHIESDALDFRLLFGVLPELGEEREELLSAAFRALFLTACHRREVGEKQFDGALRLLVRGLCLQMTEGMI